MKSIIYAALGVVLLLGAAAVGRYTAPTPTPVVRIDSVDRPLDRRDTSGTAARVEYRRIFVPDTKVVNICEEQVDTVLVPVRFQPEGIISSTPIRFEGGRVELTYVRPETGGFVQDYFTIPRPRWGYGLHLAAGADITGRIRSYDPVLYADAYVRYRRIRLSVRPVASINPRITVSLAWRLVGRP